MGVCVGGDGGGGVERENFRPVCQFGQVYSSCFYGKTTQEHLFKSHRSACEVWLDSDILGTFIRNGGYAILARIHSIISSLHDYFGTMWSSRKSLPFTERGRNYTQWDWLKKKCITCWQLRSPNLGTIVHTQGKFGEQVSNGWKRKNTKLPQIKTDLLRRPAGCSVDSTETIK